MLFCTKTKYISAEKSKKCTERGKISEVYQTETGYDRENGKTMPEREKVRQRRG